ncbi:MAG: DUF2339 domain-containing protein [Flavobacteriales bacterium]
MEIIFFILILLLLLVINNNVKAKHELLENKIEDLTEVIRTLYKKLNTSGESAQKNPSSVNQEIIREEIVSKPLPKQEVKQLEAQVEKKELVQKPVQQQPDFIVEEKTTAKKIEKPIEEEVPSQTIFEKFKERNPDLEKFIGENLINKIGILILVLGISFFVKYAIDKEWINEPARVGIGILCGALVMAVAHRLKKNYTSFSSVLVAGAISIFYFTIYFAFHQYQLFSQTTAFIIMVVITAFSALVSVSYNRQELAILSLIGGFSVPFMLSTGEGNYLVLFTYIAILNIGMLAISYFKKWKIATIVSFAFTTLLYAGWLGKSIDEDNFSHAGALTFATLFYFIFSVIIVLNNLRNKGNFSTIEYVMLVVNTFFFFGIGMAILTHWDSKLTGLFTLLLAIYNVIYAVILFRKFGLDKNAIYLLIGLALTFVTLTVPIQFSGNQITLFWAAEAVLLLWLSQKSKINAFKLGGIIVQILAVIGLIMDWARYTTGEELSVILNPLFITGLVVVISLFSTLWLLKQEGDIVTNYVKIDISIYRTVVFITAVVLAYLIGILEVNHQSTQFIGNKTSAWSLPTTYHFVFVAVLLFLSSYFKKKIVTQGVLILSAVSILIYIVGLFRFPSQEITDNYIYNTSYNYAFYLHYIILGCLVYFGVELYRKVKTNFAIEPGQVRFLAWVFAFVIVFILSNEIMIHSLFVWKDIDVGDFAERNTYQKAYFIKEQITAAKLQVVKIGYPILWGIFSFIFLIVGIKKQWKTLRIIALSLLGITIVKLFVYDIQNVSETGKIIAFILLGVLILIISFVYQKIKKLVLDETTENSTENE